VEKMLTLAELGELLSLSQSALRRAVARGDLRAKRILGRLRFAPEDVEAFVELESDARRDTAMRSKRAELLHTAKQRRAAQHAAEGAPTP
jgi:excisionase family DNA binding protein